MGVRNWNRLSSKAKNTRINNEIKRRENQKKQNQARRKRIIKK